MGLGYGAKGLGLVLVYGSGRPYWLVGTGPNERESRNFG